MFVDRMYKSCDYSNIVPTCIALMHEGNKLTHFNESRCLNTHKVCAVYRQVAIPFGWDCSLPTTKSVNGSSHLCCLCPCDVR